LKNFKRKHRKDSISINQKKFNVFLPIFYVFLQPANPAFGVGDFGRQAGDQGGLVVRRWRPLLRRALTNIINYQFYLNEIKFRLNGSIKTRIMMLSFKELIKNLPMQRKLTI
jgi:hypothetical protein